MQNDNFTCVLNRLVAEFGITVTRQAINEELERHADHNSIRPFSGVLNRPHVPKAAYKLKFDELGKASVPFIAHLSNKELQ